MTVAAVDAPAAAIGSGGGALLSSSTPPPKGLFTQTACVLLGRIPSRDELRQALRLAIETEARLARGGAHWYEGDPLLVVPFAPERNGYALVDLVERPWPDDLESLAAADDALAAAWQIGHFGPGAWPGALARAAEHCRACPAASTAAERHVAFLRIRLTYLLGVPGKIDQPYPAGDPKRELLFLDHLLGALLTLRGALASFHPAGESLRGAAFLEERVQHRRHGGPPPLDVWTNVRHRPAGEGSPWTLIDSVGMAQLDLPDVEAIIPTLREARFPAAEMEAFLRNACLLLLREGEDAALGRGAVPGPGGAVWRAQRQSRGYAAPPRPVLRFSPRGRFRPPEGL